MQVTAVLPLIADPEASVQLKVATSMSELVLHPFVAWFRNIQRNTSDASMYRAPRNKTTQTSPAENGTSAGDQAIMSWQILSRIADADQVKLLRECMRALLKQQVIGCSEGHQPATNAKLSLIELLEAAKTACCGTPQDTPHAVNDISQLRLDDPAYSSRAGWILLEALVGQESNQPQGRKQRLYPSDSTSSVVLKAINFGLRSADFVVLCFMRRRQWHIQSKSNPKEQAQCPDILDEEEIRMLKVLQILVHQLPDSDAQQLKQTLIPLLSNLRQTPAATTVCIQALFALSMVGCSDSNDVDVDTDAGYLVKQERCYNEVRHWCGQLFAACFPVLMAYTWGSEVSTQYSLSQQQTQHNLSQTQISSHCVLGGLPPVILCKQVISAVYHPGNDAHECY
jgi:hypothetical protein